MESSSRGCLRTKAVHVRIVPINGVSLSKIAHLVEMSMRRRSAG